MSTHTRTDIEVSDYECAMNDCGHEVRPCPSWTEDACRDCTDRSWDEHEGPVVTWDECQGTGAIWDETFDPEPTDSAYDPGGPENHEYDDSDYLSPGLQPKEPDPTDGSTA